jgi:hypothetical protein
MKDAMVSHVNIAANVNLKHASMEHVEMKLVHLIKIPRITNVMELHVKVTKNVFLKNALIILPAHLQIPVKVL